MKKLFALIFIFTILVTSTSCYYLKNSTNFSLKKLTIENGTFIEVRELLLNMLAEDKYYKDFEFLIQEATMHYQSDLKPSVIEINFIDKTLQEVISFEVDVKTEKIVYVWKYPPNEKRIERVFLDCQNFPVDSDQIISNAISYLPEEDKINISSIEMQIQETWRIFISFNDRTEKTEIWFDRDGTLLAYENHSTKEFFTKHNYV